MPSRCNMLMLIDVHSSLICSRNRTYDPISAFSDAVAPFSSTRTQSVPALAGEAIVMAVCVLQDLCVASEIVVFFVCCTLSQSLSLSVFLCFSQVLVVCYFLLLLLLLSLVLAHFSGKS